MYNVYKIILLVHLLFYLLKMCHKIAWWQEGNQLKIRSPSVTNTYLEIF